MQPITPAAPGPFAAGDPLGSCTILEATADSLRWGIGKTPAGILAARWPLLGTGFTPLVVSAMAWTAGGAWIALAAPMAAIGVIVVAAALRPSPLEWSASRRDGLRIDRLAWLLRRRSETFPWRDLGKFSLTRAGLAVETPDRRTHPLLPARAGEEDAAAIERLTAALSAMLAAAAPARSSESPRHHFKERKRAA